MVKECRPLELGVEYFDESPFVQGLFAQGFKPYMVLKELNQAISNANLEFTKVAGTLTHVRVTNSGSYIDLAIVSSSADDDTSTNKHCRRVKLWGIDSSGCLRVEQLAPDGTTSASTTNAFFEIGDFYGSAFGTAGADAAGNIDIAVTGKVTNELMRIAVNTRVAVSSRIPIPKSWRAKILSVNIYPHDADVALSSGIMFYPHYYDAYDCTEEDSTLGKVSVMRNGAQFGISQWPRVYGNDNTYGILEFLGNRVKNSETWHVSARVVMWATHACSSNRRDLIGDR